MIVTDWQGRHGLTSAQYQQAFDELLADGYRLVKVSGFDDHGEPRYAGLWHRRGGGDWQARHGQLLGDFMQAHQSLAAQGFRIVHVSAFRQGNGVRFSGIWEIDNGLMGLWFVDDTSTGYQQRFIDLSNSGYRLRCVAGYDGGDGGARYASIWDQYAGPAWQGRHGLDSSQYQQAFDSLTSQGYRPVQVVGYSVSGQAFYAGVWEQSPGNRWRARHGLPADQYQGEFDGAIRDGLRLVDVNGLGTGSEVRYTTIWEDASQDRPDADAINALVIPFVQKWEVPGMALAVARDGEVISSRLFGHANPITREILLSATRLRIASLTKPITSAAIFRLIERSRLRLNDTVFGNNGILGNRFGTPPYAPGIDAITVLHLLQHTAGGWANDSNDPMYLHPELSQADLISWTLDNQGLLNPPGTFFAYSNFGYCVLGRVIEAVSALRYSDYVRSQVLQPMGITTMELAADSASMRHPDEALYHGLGGASAYGFRIDRMDSHGGWIASADDVLQFVLRDDGFAVPPDLLAAASISTMTAPGSVNPSYACGWSLNVSAGTRWHSGLLSGTASILVRGDSGHEWCAICTSGLGNSGIVGQLDSLLWQVDQVL